MDSTEAAELPTNSGHQILVIPTLQCALFLHAPRAGVITPYYIFALSVGSLMFPSIVDCRVRYCSLPMERFDSGCRTGNARRNIVSTVNMGCPLNLKQIAMGARNAEFNPKVRYSLTVATDLSLRKQSTNLPSSPVWRYVLEYLAAICRGDHAHPGTQDNGADIRLGQNGTPLMTAAHLWATII